MSEAGPRRLSLRYQWRSGSRAPRESEGQGTGTLRRKALRIWKAAALARCLWKGFSAPCGAAGETPAAPNGATGSVSDQATRPAWCRQSTAWDKKPQKWGEPPRGERVVMVTAGERDSNRVTTQVWRCPRAIQSPLWRVRSEASHNGARGRAGSEAGGWQGDKPPT